jgi:hypothetical protein
MDQQKAADRRPLMLALSRHPATLLLILLQYAVQTKCMLVVAAWKSV